jgi:20S proteasome alpha/beta subunit
MNASNKIRITDQDVATIGSIAGTLKKFREKDISPSEAMSFIVRSLKCSFEEGKESDAIQQIVIAIDRLKSKTVSDTEP